MLGCMSVFLDTLDIVTSAQQDLTESGRAVATGDLLRQWHEALLVKCRSSSSVPRH